MATGKAVFIGVNEINPDNYGGWDGKLRFPESDAKAVAEIAQAKGFENPTMLLTKDATTHAVRDAITSAAKDLESGDMFLLYYSGHGNTMADESGDEGFDEKGLAKKDSTWCLYDDELLDDEISVLCAQFVEGVRVLVLSDSCHSGSMTMGSEEEGFVVKGMPELEAQMILLLEPERYSQKRSVLPDTRPDFRATVMLLSGCKDHQQSFEYSKGKHGHFTYALLQAWGDPQGEGFQGDYDALIKAIDAGVGRTKQTPQKTVKGTVNPDFTRQNPFQI